MKCVAVIPAKARSTRVPNKNFRDFYKGQSLLEIKIAQCLASGVFEDVYVSSDSTEAQALAEKSGAKFLLREQHLCADETPWSEVLEGILNTVPIEANIYIGWCMATSPLFSRFKELVLELEKRPDKDSVVTVTPLKHYFLNADYIPINHQWGPWHSYSQGMRPIYQMNLACLLAKKSTMIANQYQIGNKPIFFNTSVFETIDIDTLEEYEIARMLYAQKQDSPE